jgi:hypothetical protein
MRFGIFLAVITMTTLCWFGVQQLRAAGSDSCHDDCRTFGSYVQHDPYCAVDPVCVSPFYDPSWVRRGVEPQNMPHWRGLAWLGESGTYGTGLRMLSIPNYVGFMVLICGLATLVIWKVRRRLVRGVLLTALLAWLVVEVLRWFAVISDLDPTVSWLNGELVATLAISMGFVWVTIKLASRKRPVELM